MARRGHIGGGRQGFQIDPIAFLQGGGGDNKGDTEMAMALMGYGKGGGPEARALDERTQAALELFQQGQLANMAEGRRIEEGRAKSEAEARTAATADTAEQRRIAAQNEIQRQKEAAANLDYLKTAKQQETTERLIGDLMQHGQMTASDPRLVPLLERTSPGFKADMQQVAAADREDKITKGLATYQAADPKKRAAIAKDPAGAGIPADIYDEVLKRANVNVAQPGAPAAAPAAAPGEGRLPLSSLNAPTAPPGSDIFSEKGVRIGPPLIDARDYSKFPGSVEDLIRLSSNKPIPEQLVASRPEAAPPVVSAPPTPVNMPRASVESIAPGLNMPREEFNLIPESTDQYQPGASFSRQGLPDLHLIPEPYQRPGVDLMVDDLLERLRGNRGTSVPMPVGSGYPFPGQGVFQPHPG